MSTHHTSRCKEKRLQTETNLPHVVAADDDFIKIIMDAKVGVMFMQAQIEEKLFVMWRGVDADGVRGFQCNGRGGAVGWVAGILMMCS